MSKKKADTTFEPLVEEVPDRPDPEASNLEAAHNAAVVEELMAQPELVTSGFGILVFNPEAEDIMTFAGVHAEFEEAKRAAQMYKKSGDETVILIPVPYFC